MTDTAPLTVRPLDAPDAAAFQALRLQGLAEAPSAFASSLEEEQDLPLDTVAQRLVPAPGAVVHGAFSGTALVAVAGLAREARRKLAHKGFIWGVYVAPAWRRAGAGRLLLTTVLEAAARMDGLRQVNLGVNATNAAAIRLYESLGFTAFGREPANLWVDGTYHDELHMVRVLAR